MAAMLVISLVCACAPDEIPLPPALAEGCVTAGCHGKVEQIHYGGPRLLCVDCHGGDPTSILKEIAHVTVETSFNASTPGSNLLDDPPLAALDALPDDVIRFINPSDYRVARQTCGSSILGGGNCHTTVVENSMLLGRATLIGTLAGGGYHAGTQGKEPLYGVVAARDEWVPAQLPAGTVQSVDQLPGDVPDHIDDPTARAFYPVFEQLCLECHVYRDGPKVPGRYYSSGCNACHMLTADDARALTADETQDRDELGHVQTHRFTNLIPDSQCARCHISHLGRSLLAQGVRERSEAEGDKLIDGPNRGVEDPEHHVPWGEVNYVKYKGQRQIFGKPYPFFIEDEDGRNEVDETPPDIHTEKGLGCIDCHNIREAHGDKQMAARMDGEIDVRCESCHGRPGELGSLVSDAGLVFARSATAVQSSGDNVSVLTKGLDGEVSQHGRFTGVEHPVTQIERVTDPAFAGHNPRTAMGCELHAGTEGARQAIMKAVNALSATDPAAVAEAYPGLPEGFTFPEEEIAREGAGRVECFTCHNRWTLNCYGCHMVRDDRQSYTSRLTGETKWGRVNSFGLSVVPDALALGFNPRGKISPMVGTSIFFTHIDKDGARAIDAVALRTGDGHGGDANTHNAVHHHTTRKLPRDCDGCHPSASDSHDPDALRRAVGLGTDTYLFVDGEGRIHRLDKLVAVDLDGDGEPDELTGIELPDSIAESWALAGNTHPRLGDLPPERPDPGPLNLETINRVLQSVVVPQRPAGAPDASEEEP